LISHSRAANKPTQASNKSANTKACIDAPIRWVVHRRGDGLLVSIV
jgi:hypothetical protein